jgi:gamma-glutamylcyclotransferase (GGCT)/AIG2-like uncharacterized protein YtfP
MAHRVFVYGSLKRGQSNHHWLNGATFVGRARLQGAELYSLGPYPMAVLRHGSSQTIHGEVFEVNAEGLDQLDVLEDYPGYYDRQILSLGDGSQAWVYLGSDTLVEHRSLVEYGDWASTPVFSYGSNMDPTQLQQRCRDWDGSGLVARLDGWRWDINKIADGGVGEGYAGIAPHPGAHCWGVVHHLSHRDRRSLDQREGVARDHYRHQSVTVMTPQGESFEALTYVPAPGVIAEGLRASSDYQRRILAGAAHWGLESAWCNALRELFLITA